MPLNDCGTIARCCPSVPNVIELPRWDAKLGDQSRCLAQIDAWAEYLRDHAAIAAFSAQAAAVIRAQNGAQLLHALESFAGKYWDFRGGRERNLADQPEFTSRQSELIDSVAQDLGLTGTPGPRRREYDAVVMTGGMVRAGIVKPRYLRELSDHGLSWKEGIFLGGFRPFAGDEVVLAPRLGVVGSNEFDAMTTGMCHAFSLGPPNSTRGFVPSAGVQPGPSSWREVSWGWNRQTLRVIAAPSSLPERRRANTADTYRFWAARTEGIKSVLIVTTPIYVPYQGATAIEILGIECGFSVETVAVSDAASDLGVHSQDFQPQHRAQELRSAIYGLRRLRSRLIALS